MTVGIGTKVSDPFPFNVFFISKMVNFNSEDDT